MANANSRNTSREGSASGLGQGDGGDDRREGFGLSLLPVRSAAAPSPH